MKQYKYTGRDHNGKKVSGVVEAVNEKNALVMLRPSVSVVLSLSELNDAEDSTATIKDESKGFSLFERFKAYNPSLADKAFLIYQLSSMLEAGIDLVPALETLAEEYEDPKARSMLKEMAERMREGESFAEVLARYPRFFTPVFINVVRAGEEAGKLPETLASLSEQLDYLYKIRGKVIGAMAYPAFTLLVAIIIVIIILVKVLPMFEQIYAGSGARLPALTRLLIYMSHVIRDNTALVCLITLAIILLIRWMWTLPTMRLKMESIIYRLPVFGTILKEYIYVQTSRVLALLIRSGVHIIDSLQFTASATPWLHFKKGLQATLEGVRLGESMADLMHEHKVLPGIAVRMLKVGEETGQIDDMLNKIGDFYHERVDNKVKMLSSLIEPLLIVILGALIGFILIAMYLPIFMLGTTILH